jgi:hypothetical protein
MHDTLLEEIKSSFLSERLKPIRRCFFLQDEGDEYACVVVALAIHRGVTDRSDSALAKDEAANIALEWASNVFGEDFIWGLLSAWDGQTQVKDDPSYLAGYELGLDAVTLFPPRGHPT